MSTATEPKKRVTLREKFDAAQEKIAKLDQYNHLLIRALRAIRADKVHWTPRRGNYRLGLYDVDSPSGERVIVEFYGNADPDVCPYYFDEWSEWYTRGSIVFTDDPDYRALRELIDIVRGYIYTARKQEGGN